MSVPKTIVIAGGTGFVGQQLTQVLRRQGHHVRVLSRRKQYPDTHFWNPLKPDTFIHHLAKCDVVINLCGASIAGFLWTKKRKQYLRDSRLIPTNALVDAINRRGHSVSLLIQASAVGIYPSSSAMATQRSCDEESSLASDFLGKLCHDWEAPIHQLNNTCRAVPLRLGVVLGNSGGMYVPLSRLFRFFMGHGIGKGNQAFPWVHIDDVVSSIRYCMEATTIKGPVNCVAPQLCTFETFIRHMALVLKRPCWFTIPERVLRQLLGEFSQLFTHGQRVTPSKLLQNGFSFQYKDIGTALIDLNR